MAILGNIIKRFIDIKDTFSSEQNHVEAQQIVLKDLITKAKDTEFGKHFDFKNMLESENMAETFSETIPYFDYNKINEEWWHRFQEGENDVTWPGHQKYFALS